MGFDGWTNIEEVHLLTTHLSYDDDDDGDNDSGGDGVVMKTLIDFFKFFGLHISSLMFFTNHSRQKNE